MGRYSRKDMIEFANYAKSYQSPKNVYKAYDAYLKGARLISFKQKEKTLLQKIRESNVVYVNGKTIKDKYLRPEKQWLITQKMKDSLEKFYVIKSWNKEMKILFLTKR